MGDRIKTGDFGRFVFTIKFKSRYGMITTLFDIEGAEVIDEDSRNVWLKDADKEYLVTRRRITYFEHMEKVGV
jgi:hypothetical protein